MTSNGRYRRKMNAEEIAEMTKVTVKKIEYLHANRRLGPNTVVSYHDMSSPGYGWLLPGWVAEERCVESGRIYRYYYDPEGEYYRTQKQVLETFEMLGVVVLDTN